jgi:hypothetical protein
MADHSLPKTDQEMTRDTADRDATSRGAGVPCAPRARGL